MQNHPLFQKVVSAFRERFRTSPRIVVRAPGRINLIGEHTDYNHGFVLPAAIDQAVWFALSDSGNGIHVWHSEDMSETAQVRVDEDLPRKGWAAYFQAAHQKLRQQQPDLGGVHCVFASDLPVGAGLSSSSALTSGFLLGMDALFGVGNSRESLAWMAHLAEHDFIGLEGGIMDQHACLLAQPGHFLFLDCLNRTFRQVPFETSDEIGLLLINTRIQHKLTESDYNTRVRECKEALKILKEQTGIETLRDLSDIDLEAYAAQLGPLLYRRVGFVKSENQRVLKAVQALQERDWDMLGSLLIHSHSGLRDAYEVSCAELDFLVEGVSGEEAFLGSRMMGGGFGGCTINLVRGPVGDSFRRQLAARYAEKFGLVPDFIPVYPAAGAGVHALV